MKENERVKARGASGRKKNRANERDVGLKLKL